MPLLVRVRRPAYCRKWSRALLHAEREPSLSDRLGADLTGRRGHLQSWDALLRKSFL